jgi:hypothetical protein
LFNHGVVSDGVRGNYTIFAGLLAEVMFASFWANEEALECKLLPSSEDSIQLKRELR